MPNSILLKTIAAALLTVTFLATSACSNDDDSDSDKGDQSAISGRPGKPSGPTGSKGGLGGGNPTPQPGLGGTPSPTNGDDSRPGTGNGGSAGPGGSANSGDGSTPADPGNTDGSQPPPANGGSEGDPEEQAAYEMLTQVFTTYLPLGTYTGKSDDGMSCTLKVRPFDKPGKDLFVEMELSGGNTGSPNDKLTFTLSTKLGGTLVGAPKENPPKLRMWVEVAIPAMTLGGPGHVLTMLNVKFDPATNKAESVYIFDQTREGLANTSANCFIESFTPAAGPTAN